MFLYPLLQADNDRGRALREILWGQEAAPALPLWGHQSEAPRAQNALTQTAPSSTCRSPYCQWVKNATSSHPEGSMLCDHESKEHYARDEWEENYGEDDKVAEVLRLKVLKLINTKNVSTNTNERISVCSLTNFDCCSYHNLDSCYNVLFWLDYDNKKD